MRRGNGARRLAAGLGLVLALAGVGAGCAGSAPGTATALRPDLRPVQIGRGAGYRLPAVSAAVSHRAMVGALSCANAHPGRFGVHLELYAHRLVLPVPAGLGIAPPQLRQGAYVRGGTCSYPIRTFEPTGVVIVDQGRVMTLGALFAIWGQPLSRYSLTGFRGPVLAFVAGRRWRPPVALIPLSRHAEIVLEVSGYVPPHPLYHFPPGV